MRMLKTLILLFAVGIASNPVRAFADPDPHSHGHARHYMVLVGQNEIFASHVVFKEPHNYQVILSLKLDEKALSTYQVARQLRPQAKYYLYLDSINMAEIASLPSITGSLIYEETDQDQDHVLAPSVTILRKNFEVLYFQELPLSLKADSVL